MGAVDADHQHGGERRELDRHPHQADIVGDQREVHREHQHLIHRVIEAQVGRRQPAGLQLVADIARAEHAGGEADEGGQHDEDVVEVVDQQIGARLRPPEEQRQRGQRRSASVASTLSRARQPIAGQQRQQRRGHRRDDAGRR